jgi:uncharacterized protein
MWRKANKVIVSFDDVDKLISKVSFSSDHKIIVGTDSLVRGQHYIFTTAICILTCETSDVRRYFYQRKTFDKSLYKSLYKRLVKETSDSISIANELKSKYPNTNIEIHLDINQNDKHKSSAYKNALLGYVQGYGFEYKFKPDSFVASCIADRHTK